MKTCRDCGLEKPLEEFSKRSKNADGHTNWCLTCKRDYDRAYYHDTANTRRSSSLEKKKRLRVRNQRNIREYFETHHCVDCGEGDPVVLEFDHVRGAKKSNVSALISSCWNWQTIMEEIEKCDVRCANCHRRKTFSEMGHMSWLTEDIRA